MNGITCLAKETGTHKPLVGGSNPPAATSSIFVIASEVQQSLIL